MRKLFFGLLFILSLLFFLYLNFPFERFIESSLCKRGITAQKVEFHRLPPEVVLKEVRAPALPFPLELVRLKPSLNLKEFSYYCRVCKGEVEGKFTNPLTYFSFKAKGIEVGKCYGEKVKLEGKAAGEGYFKLKRGELTAGEGEVKGSSLKLKGVAFGLFQAELLDLGEFKGSYRVIGKNLLELKGKGSGRDADYELSGSLNFNPKRPGSSYLNLKITVKVKKEPLKGKSFTFNLRGSVNNLRLW